MTDRNQGAPPLSDRLMEAATRIGDIPHDELARLLMKAAIRLRVVVASGALEHIPVHAYSLLRQLSLGPIAVKSLHGRDDRAALVYLVTRQLAESSSEGLVSITPAGEELGEVADERLQASTQQPST